MSELRIRLTGDQAELGHVPAADVARLILGVERAMMRAASVVLNRPKVTGRYEEVIEQATRLRLRAVEAGSVVSVLDLPASSDNADDTLMLEVASLGEMALATMLDAVDTRSEPHVSVVSALVELTDTLRIGERYDAIELDVATSGAPARCVRIDGITRGVWREYVEAVLAVPAKADAVVGVLVEADFEKNTARLRSPTDQAVIVEFPEELADEIQTALRQSLTAVGEVSYDPRTETARSVAVRSVSLGQQLMLGIDSDAFWAEPTFEDLARQQRSGALMESDTLHNDDATDDERDAFLAALVELD